MIQMRPRSSNVMATGLTMSGSLATSSTLKPSGTVILAIASAGDRGGPGGFSWRRGMNSSACKTGLSKPPDRAKARPTARRFLDDNQFCGQLDMERFPIFGKTDGWSSTRIHVKMRLKLSFLAGWRHSFLIMNRCGEASNRRTAINRRSLLAAYKRALPWSGKEPASPVWHALSASEGRGAGI